MGARSELADGMMHGSWDWRRMKARLGWEKLQQPNVGPWRRGRAVGRYLRAAGRQGGRAALPRSHDLDDLTQGRPRSVVNIANTLEGSTAGSVAQLTA